MATLRKNKSKEFSLENLSEKINLINKNIEPINWFKKYFTTSIVWLCKDK